MGIVDKLSTGIEIPLEIREYTEQPIPRDITDDEIDAWLAVVPDLLEFWEIEVADKKRVLDMRQHEHGMQMTICYNEANDNLAVKNREHIASADPRVRDAAQAVILAKYELQLVQAVFGKMESKSHSIHKIASLRARRLECGVVAPSVRGDPSLRTNPQPRPRTSVVGNEKVIWGKSTQDSVQQDLHKELSKELNDDVF